MDILGRSPLEPSMYLPIGRAVRRTADGLFYRTGRRVSDAAEHPSMQLPSTVPAHMLIIIELSSGLIVSLLEVRNDEFRENETRFLCLCSQV